MQPLRTIACSVIALFCLCQSARGQGTVSAWGDNSFGELGNGTNTASNTPMQVSGLSGVTAIAGGELHGLALKSDGTVWAWGYNFYGQLGNGTNTDSNTPVEVLGPGGVGFLSGVTAIAGGRHSLALKSDGTVWAWGVKRAGGLGNGTTTDGNTSVKKRGLSGVTCIVGGEPD